MAIEHRNGRLYYTLSTRVRGKVKREYIGSGIFGLLASLLDQQARHEQQEQHRLRQEAWQAERQAVHALNETVGAACQDADTLFQAAMEAAGYHKHARSEWRKKRRENPDHD